MILYLCLVCFSCSISSLIPLSISSLVVTERDELSSVLNGEVDDSSTVMLSCLLILL